jgi:hypothetical protein
MTISKSVICTPLFADECDHKQEYADRDENQPIAVAAGSLRLHDSADSTTLSDS